MMPMIAISTPSSTIRPIGASGMVRRASSGVTAAATTTPVTAPSTVFFGLMRGASGRRPIVRPP